MTNSNTCVNDPSGAKSKSDESSLPRPSGFARFSASIAKTSGRPAAFVLAATSVLVWATTGPIFDFSDTWQLVINTGTTIVTFLMVFLIQNTQNRDTVAIQIKLDELIRAVSKARNEIIDVEDRDEEYLEALREDLVQVAEAAAKESADIPPGDPSQ